MQRKISIIELPQNPINHFINNDEIYIYYLNYITNLVIESIGIYYSKDYISTNLAKKIKLIEPNNYNESIDNITKYFENNTLKLPNYFFNIQLTEEKYDLSTILKQYPVIKPLLTSYGIYALFTNNQSSQKEKQLKKLLATHFATQSNIINNPKFQKIKFADKTFQTYSPLNSICENIIKELALILGDEVLLKTLEKDSQYLINIIDKTTKKKLGQKIITKLIQLDTMCQQLIKIVNIESYSDQLLKNKLLPIYKLIDKYSADYQNQIFNQLEHNNFEISILTKFNLNTEQLIPITKDEKDILKEYIIIFNNSFNQLIPFLSTDCPNITEKLSLNSNLKISKDDFSFMNKALTIMNLQSENYNNLCISITTIWKQLNEQIVLQLLPNYLKYNKSKIINFDEILKLSAYTNSNIIIYPTPTEDENYFLDNSPIISKILKKENKQKKSKNI